MKFCIEQTALVEVNDAYVAGRYDGMPAKDFTDMLVVRFAALQKRGAAAAAMTQNEQRPGKL